MEQYHCADRASSADQADPRHIEQGWEPDFTADLAHMKKYLSLFGEKVTNAPKKARLDKLFSFFKDSFPQATKNLDFFLGHLSNGHLSNQFGEGGTIWEENRHQNPASGRATSYWGICLSNEGGRGS